MIRIWICFFLYAPVAAQYMQRYLPFSTRAGYFTVIPISLILAQKCQRHSFSRDPRRNFIRYAGCCCSRWESFTESKVASLNGKSLHTSIPQNGKLFESNDWCIFYRCVQVIRLLVSANWFDFRLTRNWVLLFGVFKHVFFSRALSLLSPISSIMCSRSLCLLCFGRTESGNAIFAAHWYIDTQWSNMARYHSRKRNHTALTGWHLRPAVVFGNLFVWVLRHLSECCCPPL